MRMQTNSSTDTPTRTASARAMLPARAWPEPPRSMYTPAEISAPMMTTKPRMIRATFIGANYPPRPDVMEARC